MKYFVILLILIGFIIPQAFASDSFHGTSSFESVPSELSRHFPSTFEIKFQYTAGPWGLSDLVPVIEIVPENASSQVQLDFEPTHVQKNSIARIPVTITIDRTIEYEKIFLSVSFEGNGSNDVLFKSGWTDSLIFSIGPRDEIGTLVDYEKISWEEFDLPQNDYTVIYTKNTMMPLSILEKGQHYSIVQKVDFRDDNFAENSTFDAVVGYAFQKGDKMVHPPRGENVTDADHQEFAQKNQKLNNEFYQQSEIAKSFEFKINPEKPFYVKSSLIFNESGVYTHQYYKKLKFSPAVLNSNMGGLTVVDKFSKAVDENAVCKNEDLRRLIKYNFSTMVCVDRETAWKLIERGWGI